MFVSLHGRVEAKPCKMNLCLSKIRSFLNFKCGDATKKTTRFSKKLKFAAYDNILMANEFIDYFGLCPRVAHCFVKPTVVCSTRPKAGEFLRMNFENGRHLTLDQRKKRNPKHVYSGPEYWKKSPRRDI